MLFLGDRAAQDYTQSIMNKGHTNIRDLQIGVRVQLSNFNPDKFPEPSLLPEIVMKCKYRKVGFENSKSYSISHS